WTANGGGTTTAGNIFASSAPVWIGSAQFTSTDHFKGRVTRVILRNGIAGPTVLDVSENNALGATTSFTATTGQIVTVNQSGATIVQPQPILAVDRPLVASVVGTGTPSANMSISGA